MDTYRSSMLAISNKATLTHRNASAFDVKTLNATTIQEATLAPYHYNVFWPATPE